MRHLTEREAVGACGSGNGHKWIDGHTEEKGGRRSLSFCLYLPVDGACPADCNLLEGGSIAQGRVVEELTHDSRHLQTL